MALDHFNSSLLIGRRHIKLKQVNSTNKYTIEYLSKSKPTEGTVISASYQTDGRGQIGRFWESEEGKNITCSTILMPIFLKASDQFSLNTAVSLAIHDLISHFLPENQYDIRIKWPNDIYVNDAKIAGILIQNSLSGKNIKSSVVGTGININQTHFSSELPNPTSLKIVLGRAVDLDLAYSWLFRFMTKRYYQLKNNYEDQLKNEYLSNLYRRDQWAEYLAKDNVRIKAKIIGVDEIGQLKVMLEDGTDQTFGFREISFLF